MTEDKKILSCCPYCGEDYMFEKVSETRYYGPNYGEVTMVMGTYHCYACRRTSTIIHDFVNKREYCGNDD